METLFPQAPWRQGKLLVACFNAELEKGSAYPHSIAVFIWMYSYYFALDTINYFAPTVFCGIPLHHISLVFDIKLMQCDTLGVLSELF